MLDAQVVRTQSVLVADTLSFANCVWPYVLASAMHVSRRTTSLDADEL